MGDSWNDVLLEAGFAPGEVRTHPPEWPFARAEVPIVGASRPRSGAALELGLYKYPGRPGCVAMAELAGARSPETFTVGSNGLWTIWGNSKQWSTVARVAFTAVMAPTVPIMLPGIGLLRMLGTSIQRKRGLERVKGIGPLGFRARYSVWAPEPEQARRGVTPELQSALVASDFIGALQVSPGALRLTFPATGTRGLRMFLAALPRIVDAAGA